MHSLTCVLRGRCVQGSGAGGVGGALREHNTPPGCTLNDLSKLFGIESGSQWYGEVPDHDTAWYAPVTPWQWQPLLLIL